MTASDIKKEFQQLLTALLDGDISSAECDRLHALLEQYPNYKNELREQLIFANLIGQLENEQHHADQFHNSVMLEIDKEKSQPETSLLISTKKTFLNFHSLHFLFILTCLISVVASMVFFSSYSPIKSQIGDKTTNGKNHHPIKTFATESFDDGIAVIVNQLNTKLIDNKKTLKVGDSIAPSQLVFSQGFIELEFYQGARVTIQGPAKIELVNAARINIKQGKLTVELPEVAKGFTIDTPVNEVISLASFIGVAVNQKTALVEVFDGKIEARTPQGKFKIYHTGQKVNFKAEKLNSWQVGSAVGTNQSSFTAFKKIDQLVQSALLKKKNSWLKVKAKLLQDNHLVAYYDFNQMIGEKSKRTLKNIAPTGAQYDGAIVGAQWTPKGPWLDKQGLNFKRAADRVRINIDKPMRNFTMATWVRIDSLDRTLSSLLLADDYNQGDMHWQIINYNTEEPNVKPHNPRHGNLLLGLRATANKSKNYSSKPFFALENSGNWYHLAVTVDTDNKTVTHYKNGDVFQKLNLAHLPKNAWNIGSATIGNWTLIDTVAFKRKKPIRNLNGAIAEMIIFDRALDENEIAEIALNPQ